MIEKTPSEIAHLVLQIDDTRADDPFKLSPLLRGLTELWLAKIGFQPRRMPGEVEGDEETEVATPISPVPA